MMVDILSELQSLSQRSQEVIESGFKKQSDLSARLLSYVQIAKAQIDEILALESIDDKDVEKVHDCTAKAEEVQGSTFILPTLDASQRKSGVKTRLLRRISQNKVKSQSSGKPPDVPVEVVSSQKALSSRHKEVSLSVEAEKIKPTSIKPTMSTPVTAIETPKVTKKVLSFTNDSDKRVPLVPSAIKSQSKQHGLPVSTKASKHRHSMNTSFTVAAAKTPMKAKVETESKRKWKKEQINEKDEVPRAKIDLITEKEAATKREAQTKKENDAIARKETLLKQKIEEHKKKRELKELRHQQARQQMEEKEQQRQQMEKEKEQQRQQMEKEKEQQRQQMEKEKEQQRLKTVEKSVLQKELEKPKKKVKSKKRKQSEVSDAENNSSEKGENKKADKCNTTIVISKPQTEINRPCRLGSSEDKEVIVTKKLFNETYNMANQENSETYVMTPKPAKISYNTYEISDLRPSDESDDDDDDNPKKPVPLWAQGMLLKEAIIKQHYDPPNISALFSQIYIAPDETFGMTKKKKIQRSSSAVWLTPIRPY